ELVGPFLLVRDDEGVGSNGSKIQRVGARLWIAGFQRRQVFKWNADFDPLARFRCEGLFIVNAIPLIVVAKVKAIGLSIAPNGKNHAVPLGQIDRLLGLAADGAPAPAAFEGDFAAERGDAIP